ncbi:MAG: flagellin [Pseudonocardiales bacterium]|nr:flagellin [Pseudonocardiales bacterium]
MGLRINSNVDAGSAARQLGNSQAQLSVSLERLASGRRINRGADDAAGLAIGEVLSAQVRGLNQASRNAQDAVSLIQTADGGLSQTSDVLQRVRELTVQAGNGTLSAGQRGAIQAEISELTSTIDRVATTTEFNGQAILDGSTPSAQVQTGANPSDTTTVTLPDATTTALGVGPGQVDVSSAAAANASLANIDQAISNVSGARGDLGAQQNALQSVIASNDVGAENQASARSRIVDLDYAKGVNDQVRNQLLSQLGTAVLAHANLSRESVLRLLR